GQAGEFMDLLARRAGGKAKVKPIERLDRWEAGDPGEHLTGAGPPRVTLGTQDLFEKVGKGGCLCHRALSNRPIEIGNRAEPQFPRQLGQALMLQIAYCVPPAKTS